MLIEPYEALVDSASRRLHDVPRLKIDDARAKAAGLRKIAGRRLVIYTDLPPNAEIDVLPTAFDQAFGQWCNYFGVDPAQHADWHVTGFLMKNRDTFAKAGAIPPGLPDFPHGYARNYDFWLYEQPSDYYRRHLVLHEGTHCFMNTILGACGPPWYMEGIAELLATHRWKDGRLTMNYFPQNRDETPMWGRIKIIRDAYAASKAMHLGGVIGYDALAHRRTEPYAWCWALCAMLDRDPRYQTRFRQLPTRVTKPGFNRWFFDESDFDLSELNDQWQVFVCDLDYGYDVAKSAVTFVPGKPLPPGGTTVRVAADRGWQSSGVRLEQGKTYRLRASGRYQVAKTTQVWWCEPGGVTIRYHHGQPLGILLAAVRPDPNPEPGNDTPTVCPMLHPTAVGLETTLTPTTSGTLYLRINDSSAELDDNAGQAEVQITPSA